MSASSVHPSAEELSAYSLGQLPEEQALAIDEHITGCDPCCETIVALSPEDTFAVVLKEAGQLPAEVILLDNGIQTKSPEDARGIPISLVEHPRYEVVAQIGKGGMGDVYRARHRMMDRSVALKVIKREFVGRPEAIERFHREVKTAAQLSHPNIVTAFDAEQAGDVHFLVMECVDGADLSMLVKEQGVLPVPDACEYVRQAAVGLQHAHEQGMIHRDIKPHNLMLTADGTVKILDFGLASLAPTAIADEAASDSSSDLTAAGSIMGTPDFISPEQARDAREADIRSDIYSLGSTLYFLLSGRPPFPNGSIAQKLDCHTRVDAESLMSLNADVPIELASVVERMISKNPDDRFQTPNDVVAALEPFLQEGQRAFRESLPVKNRMSFVQRLGIAFAAIASMFFVTAYADSVFYLWTEHGVVRVKVLDESLTAEINGKSFRVTDSATKLSIGVGEQNLIVRRDDSDFELLTHRFEMKRDQEIVFEVELLPGEVLLSRNGERVADASLSGSVVAESAAKPGSSFELANEAIVRAKELEKRDEFAEAADKYFEAYDLAAELVDEEHLPTIIKAKRLSDLVDFFTRSDQKTIPQINVVIALLQEDATRADGNRLLKKLWTDDSCHYELLTYRAKDVWRFVPDTDFYLRSKVLPSNVASEGPGWARFTLEGMYELAEEPGWGYPLSLRPLVHDKARLRTLAEEVELAIARNPSWQAGSAVMCYLQAEVGEFQAASKWLEQVLADADTRPIPSDSAFIFGMALEGKNTELDQQVIRLYESSMRNRPSRPFRVSAIPKLARLYAKYGRRAEARKMLYRLADVDYDPRQSQAICSPGRRPRNEARCTECHSGKSNLLDIVVMSDNLTDAGYPVDAFVSLARIDASFGNAYSSDDSWAKRTIPADFYDSLGRGQQHFVPAKERAENAVTPQGVLGALQFGVFSETDTTRPIAGDHKGALDLMVSVRGEGGDSTLFSPVLELLEVAAWSTDDDAASVNGQIDQLLARDFEAGSDNIDSGIAAAAFAIQRQELATAEKRLKKLNEMARVEEDQASDLALWLVASLALANERTREVGQELADRAVAAAENQNDQRLKEAVLGESDVE